MCLALVLPALISGFQTHINGVVDINNVAPLEASVQHIVGYNHWLSLKSSLASSLQHAASLLSCQDAVPLARAVGSSFYSHARGTIRRTSTSKSCFLTKIWIAHSWENINRGAFLAIVINAVSVISQWLNNGQFNQNSVWLRPPKAHSWQNRYLVLVCWALHSSNNWDSVAQSVPIQGRNA